MNNFDKYIDLIVQAPLAVIVLIWLYKSNKIILSIIDGYKKTMEKLIDLVKDLSKK